MNDIEIIRDYLGKNNQRPNPTTVAAAMRASGQLVTDATVLEAVSTLRRESEGAGILEDLLAIPGVTDVIVNGSDAVFLDRGMGLELTEVRFADEAAVQRLATRLAASAGRRLDESSPFVDARLKSGVRIHAILGNLTDCGTCLSLRIPQKKSLSLAQWVQGGGMCPEAGMLLANLISGRQAFLISGGTGSGKTTLLASMLSQVDARERILIVEDSRELAPAHAHVLRLESRPVNAEGKGGVTMTDLVRQALRMRPDRLVVGEIRGAELTDLLLALNTGHEGGCGTVHANSATDVPARLEALAALGGMERSALHAQLAAALRILIHIDRLPDRRRWVREISVLQPDSAGLCRAVSAAIFQNDGSLQKGAAFDVLTDLIA